MLPVAGALVRSAAVNYINPIKTSAKKLLIEKGIKNRLLNALDLSVSVTQPYVNSAARLGKTGMQKALLVTSAAIIPIAPDLKDLYEKRKMKKEQVSQTPTNTNFSIINPGAIGGTILGGAVGSIPGAMVGGIIGELMYNNYEKKKKAEKDLLNSINDINNQTSVYINTIDQQNSQNQL